MLFNADKCAVIHFRRTNKARMYTMNSSKYRGTLVTRILEAAPQVDKVVKNKNTGYLPCLAKS